MMHYAALGKSSLSITVDQMYNSCFSNTEITSFHIRTLYEQNLWYNSWNNNLNEENYHLV